MSADQLVPTACRRAAIIFAMFLWVAAAGFLRADSEPPGAGGSVQPAATNTLSAATHHPASANPKRLKDETRIVVATNALAAALAGTNTPPEKEKFFRWDASWKGWEGLQLQIVKHTELKDPLETLKLRPAGANPLAYLRLEQVKMSGKFGMRVEVDAAAFATTDDLAGFDNGAQLRRLLINAGGDCILLFPLIYNLQLGYGAGSFYLNQATLTVPVMEFLGSLTMGQFQPPMGLDLITSSRDLTFMEPAAPLQAIAPGNEAGFQVGRPVLDQRGTWALGVFAPGAGTQEYGNASRNYGSAIGRITGLPVYHPDLQNPAANRLLHLGLSGNYLHSRSSSVQYKSRPESYLAPIVINTSDLDASRAVTFATETAWVNGSFSTQAEFIRSWVNQANGPSLTFGGFYASVGWFLTGESRPYDPVAAAFTRVIPRHNFNFGHGGWGAVEVACRVSHSDLTDGNVEGGKLNLLMAGVNWHLQPHIRWLFNYGMGRLSDSPQEGRMFIFQTRIGVDF